MTDGANGWHVHVHALLCFTDDVSAGLVAAGVGARMFNRWRSKLRRQGFDASEERGWDLRKVQLGKGDLADYFTKAAHEVTGAHRKEGRRAGGGTPMQLLADAVDTYEVGTLARWWEWEAASESWRQLTWSTHKHDLRALAGFGRELLEAEVAEETPGADYEVPVSARRWTWIVANRYETLVLSFVESHGLGPFGSWEPLARRLAVAASDMADRSVPAA